MRRVGIDTNVETFFCSGQNREHAQDVVSMNKIVEFAEHGGEGTFEFLHQFVDRFGSDPMRFPVCLVNRSVKDDGGAEIVAFGSEQNGLPAGLTRSEERRVGKAWRSWWW